MSAGETNSGFKSAEPAEVPPALLAAPALEPSAAECTSDGQTGFRSPSRSSERGPFYIDHRQGGRPTTPKRKEKKVHLNSRSASHGALHVACPCAAPDISLTSRSASHGELRVDRPRAVPLKTLFSLTSCFAPHGALHVACARAAQGILFDIFFVLTF